MIITGFSCAVATCISHFTQKSLSFFMGTLIYLAFLVFTYNYTLVLLYLWLLYFTYDYTLVLLMIYLWCHRKFIIVNTDWCWQLLLVNKCYASVFRFFYYVSSAILRKVIMENLLLCEIFSSSSLNIVSITSLVFILILILEVQFFSANTFLGVSPLNRPE